eukprot:jgi/Tetstr1/449899/TSEL_036958.t1
MAVDRMGSKKASPFLLEGGAAAAKKKPPARPKPASGIVASLQQARSATREADDELRAMAARIAALQEAEAMADSRIQKVKGKVDKILSERSASNKVDYVCADDEAAGGSKGAEKRRGGSGGRNRSGARSCPSVDDSVEPAKPAANKKGKAGGLPRSSSRTAERQMLANRDTMRRGGMPAEPPAPSASARSQSADRQKPGSNTSSPRGAERPRSREEDKRRRGGARLGRTSSNGGGGGGGGGRSRGALAAEASGMAAGPSASSSVEEDDTVRYQFEDRPIGGGGTSGYVHPALLDSDSSSDEDDGPSLAEALREPGLIGMSLRDSEGALEGLLGRYADGAEQPLQGVIDDAAEEGRLAEAEARRLATRAQGAVIRAAGGAGGGGEGSCVVVELGAGAWG